MTGVKGHAYDAYRRRAVALPYGHIANRAAGGVLMGGYPCSALRQIRRHRSEWMVHRLGAGRSWPDLGQFGRGGAISGLVAAE